MRDAVAALCAAALLLWSAAARADVGDFVGKRVVAVAIEADGRPATDARVTTLVETRVGEALDMAAVRQSLTHLFSLGTFEDIRVVAVAQDDGVALTFAMRALRPVQALMFRGTVDGVDQGRLRRLVTERFGASPRANRLADMAQVVRDDLRQVGFLNAEATAGIAERPDDNHSVVVFDLTPGPRARIGTVSLVGDAGMPEATVFSRLALASGRTYEREALAQRIERFIQQRRERGFLSARMTVTVDPVENGRLVNLTVNATQGPAVRIVFEGDPIPHEREDDLVPVAREGAADQDLLEDSTIRIQDYLRAQGYRDARASFTSTGRDNELVITFTISRGPQYRVGRLEIEGNNGLTLAQVQSHLRVRAGQPYSVAALEADVAALQDAYRRAGFTTAEIQRQTTPDAPVGDGTQVPVNVVLRIVEGARTLVNAVSFEGSRAIPEATLRQGLGLQPGSPYFVTQLAIDRDAVQLRYANLGYQSASVTTSVTVSADGGSADVRYAINEGPRLFVDHVLIVGNERTKTATIERELLFKSGDPLGLEALNESQRRLASLGLFRRARITELGHGIDSRRDILVSVEEAPATTIGYGGGLEAVQFLGEPDEQTGATAQLEFAPRAFFEIGRRNLFGKNRSINLFTRISLRPQRDASSRDFSEYRIIGTFREPRAIGTGADAYLTGTLEQERRSSFNFSRRAFNAELARKLTRQVSMSGSYQIQRTEVFFNDSIDPSEQLLVDRVFPQVRLSSFSLSAVRDSRDDLADPFKGLFLSGNGQIAGRKIGSEVGLAKTFLSAQGFTPLARTRVVLATSARLGMAAGFPRQVQATGDNGIRLTNSDGSPVFVTVRDLPASERFFAGGDTTVRGFALDQLGTRETIDKGGFPIGGGGLVILNAELRIPVKGGFGAVGFFDAGNVFARTSDIYLGRLRSAVGIGLRYKSPIGPIRVDLGFKTRRYEITPGNRESASSLHISLGQAF